MFERATRLCAMSPTITTCLPRKSPRRSRSVNMSSSAWVGCSCVPSPALTTLASMLRARYSGEPDTECRITITSILYAHKFFTVSSSVSPFVTLETDTFMLTMSALRRFSASSNEARVRVLDS